MKMPFHDICDRNGTSRRVEEVHNFVLNIGDAVFDDRRSNHGVHFAKSSSGSLKRFLSLPNESSTPAEVKLRKLRKCCMSEGS